jgi:hypothetical protein
MNASNQCDIMTTTAKQSTTQVHVSTSSGKAISFFEAIKRPEGRMYATNKEVDKYLQSGKGDDMVYTGTLLVYKEHGYALGEQIRDNNLIFEVPKQYQWMKNCALVLEHPNFTIKGRLLKGEVSKVIRSFPAFEGWYLVDGDTGIPRGREVSMYEDSARWLKFLRVEQTDNIAAVVRDLDGYRGWREIIVYPWLDYPLRIATMTSEPQSLFYSIREKFDAFLRHFD